VTYGAACESDAQRCSTRTFDEDGTVIDAFEDADCDGVPDGGCTTFVEWQGGSRSELDMDCSGTPESCSIELVLANEDRRSAAGENCESASAQCTTFLKDAAGADLGYEVDDHCDGALESCFYFTEEPKGTRHGGHDIGCDGTADSGCRTVTLDASTGYTLEEQDGDCNGQAESVRCFVSDEDGVSRNAGDDGDCDGTLDAYCRTWTYDEDGEPLSLGLDDDCDGTFDHGCTTFSYDAFGHVRAEADAACDQATCTTWVHYGFAASSHAVDIGCDGEFDSNCEIWSLDDEGRPLRFDHDHDCDGTPSQAPDAASPCWTTWKYTRI
jgi:hypothetical protein